MKFGAHLPLIAFDGRRPTLEDLTGVARAARESGFDAIAANDHLVFSRPWLDAATGLASVLAESGEMKLVTTVALPVVRGPAVTAKWLAALDVLSEGRVIAGVGPGSSPRDYAVVDVPWEERWRRLDEAIDVMRAHWRGERYGGRFYASDGVHFRPAAGRSAGPPIWVGSWGSAAGLRRVARRADGWLASAYNTTPELFGENWHRLLDDFLRLGRDAARFRNGVATMWTYVTDDQDEADRLLVEVLAPTVNRTPEELRERVLFGTPERCAALVSQYQAAGAQRLFIWPVANPAEQIRRFREEVAPLVTEAGAVSVR